MTTALAAYTAVSLSACAGGVDEKLLPGTYRATYEFGTEELTIRSDGTYEQTFAETGRTPVSINRGGWTVTRGDAWDRSVLVLHDAIALVDGFGKRAVPPHRATVWRLPARRDGNQIRFVINEDIGLAFVKWTATGK
jgi:hypothetical protein